MGVDQVLIATLVPIVSLVVEILKPFIKDTRFMPIVSIGIGIIANLLYSGPSILSGVQGLVVGLAASGLYDNVSGFKE